jgi:hypothetical protein
MNASSRVNASTGLSAEPGGMTPSFESILPRAIQIPQVELAASCAPCQHAFILSGYAYTAIGARDGGEEKNHEELVRESADLECKYVLGVD